MITYLVDVSERNHPSGIRVVARARAYPHTTVMGGEEQGVLEELHQIIARDTGTSQFKMHVIHEGEQGHRPVC